jgi:DNA-binding SARP family transcriptional activator
VGLLGPLEVSVGGRPVGLTTGRLRTLLAVLAMSAGETVSLDRLAAAMWDGDLPGDARKTVQTYVTRLRGVLGAGLIGTSPAGYVLRAAPDEVDALRFLRLLDAAAVAAEVSVERARLVEALALWRGMPLEGVRSAWLENSEALRLVERYLAAVERLVWPGCCRGCAARTARAAPAWCRCRLGHPSRKDRPRSLRASRSTFIAFGPMPCSLMTSDSLTLVRCSSRV